MENIPPAAAAGPARAEAAIRCQLEACDPRKPYRISGEIDFTFPEDTVLFIDARDLYNQIDFYDSRFLGNRNVLTPHCIGVC